MSRLLALVLLAGGEGADPLPLPDVLDSYYQVLEGERHVGYVHEDLIRDISSGDFRYRRVEILAGPPSAAADDLVRVEARVARAGHVPLALTVDRSLGGMESSEDWSQQDETVKRRIRGLGTQHAVAVESPRQILPVLLLLELRQSGRLSQPGRIPARLLGAADGAIRESAVDVVVGETARRACFSGMRPMTRVTLDPPAAIVPGGPALVDAWVDRYGRLVEATLSSGRRILLVPGEREAAGSLELPARR